MAYQIHRLVRSPVTGLSEWRALRPSPRKPNDPPPRPYSWATYREAHHKLGLFCSGPTCPDEIRVVEA